MLKIREQFDAPDMIAGVATGAIAHAALVADRLELPLVYVRTEQKSHGLGNRIEGDTGTGKKVVVIEDLISTGGSSIRAVSVLREAGLDVLGMIAIFTYGFPVAEENLRKEGISFFALGNYQELVRIAAGSGYIHQEDLETLKKWREDPAVW